MLYPAGVSRRCQTRFPVKGEACRVRADRSTRARRGIFLRCAQPNVPAGRHALGRLDSDRCLTPTLTHGPGADVTRREGARLKPAPSPGPECALGVRCRPIRIDPREAVGISTCLLGTRAVAYEGFVSVRYACRQDRHAPDRT